MLPLLLLGCVLDRTGQSATDRYARELADHGRRVTELEVVSEDISRRVAQIEEVTRARGQEEILKMETMEQLRQEVARLRGDLETFQFDYQTYERAGIGFQEDSDWRMGYAELRLEAVERSLGLKPPTPPVRGGADEAAPPVTDGTPPPPADGAAPPPTDGTATPPPVEPAPTEVTSIDDYFGLIAQNLQEGKGAAARAVANRFLTEYPKSDRAPEAYYRIAESYQNESGYAEAATAFQVVIDKYGTSTWAPWSMLRQGECFESMGKKAEAKLFWEDVVRKYPKSKAAKEAKTKLGK